MKKTQEKNSFGNKLAVVQVHFIGKGPPPPPICLSYSNQLSSFNLKLVRINCLYLTCRMHHYEKGKLV